MNIKSLHLIQETKAKKLPRYHSYYPIRDRLRTKNTLSFNAGIRTVLPDHSLDSGLKGDLTKVRFAASHQTRLSAKAFGFRRSSSLPLEK